VTPSIFIQKALAQGLSASVDTGEGFFDLENSTSKFEIMRLVSGADEAHVFFFQNGDQIGWIYIVNEDDPDERIYDYSTDEDENLMDKIYNS